MTFLNKIKILLLALARINPANFPAIRSLARMSPAELGATERMLNRGVLTPEGIAAHEQLLEKYKAVGTQYHLWYYNTEVWQTTSFLGHYCMKSVSDMWNYQEILFAIKPRLVIEFGTNTGGATYYFSKILSLIEPDSRVFSVDVTLERLHPAIRSEPRIELMEASSVDAKVGARIRALRKEFPGPVFIILDSDHAKHHVRMELELLRDLTVPGDYVIVEDSNINGHPVLPGWGEGPYEALEEYLAAHPGDYVRDVAREAKFGFSFATEGFLIRK